jgi:hypothetical protein
MRKTILAAGILLLTTAASVAQQIPPGTLFPVQLDHTIRAATAKAGEPVTAKLMQDVSLAPGERLPYGTRIQGRVSEARAASAGAPARLVLVFDTVRVNGRNLAVHTSLRALASPSDVFQAELPTNMVDDYGSTIHDWNTTQVGGQGVYRGDGIVMSGPDVVGKASSVGEVYAKPIASPRSPCARDTATDREQSFWIFSTDACGLYGYESFVKLLHAGRTDPAGTIVLEGPGKLEIRGGSGLLLTVLTGDGAPTA